MLTLIHSLRLRLSRRSIDMTSVRVAHSCSNPQENMAFHPRSQKYILKHICLRFFLSHVHSVHVVKIIAPSVALKIFYLLNFEIFYFADTLQEGVPLADGVGFEPTLGFRPKHTFQACAFNHSAIHPFFSCLSYILLFSKLQEKNNSSLLFLIFQAENSIFPLLSIFDGFPLL